MTLTTGSKLGHYEITAKIGEGGMGVVYKAKDSHLDRFVAIKVLPPERVTDPTRKVRFVQEAKAASALNHPNIITVHDIDQQDGLDFIVMEYVPGKTLDQMIPRKGMKLGDALKHAVQIADALSRAHAAGIIHRDLKPGNIMVDEHGHVMVLDFGLAKLTEAAPLGEDEATRTLPTTDEGTIVGTVAYMSPEQAEGKRVDARSDIFSFGSVLYEMVTGRRAFQKDSKTSTLAAILNQEPAPLEAEIPHDLEKIIKRCLQKDPTRRFQNMADVKVALQELKEESDSGKLGAPQAAGTVLPSKGIAHLTGKKLIYIFVGLLVLAVAYLAFDKYYLKRPSIETKQVPAVSDVGKSQKTIAVLPFENLSSDPEQTYFVDGLSEELLNTLTQIPDLGVTARTSSFSFKGSNKTVQEIAKVLGVENILEGSVRKAGNELRITAQLVRATDGLHLWSKTYDRELKDIFAVQEDIAMAVANEFKTTLGVGKSLKKLGGTENEKAYELYLIAQGQMERSEYGLALKSNEAAITLDPKFALAWAEKAYIHELLTIDAPPNQAHSEFDKSLTAAQKAIEIEPNLGDAYAMLGSHKASTGDWIEAELAYRKAIELSGESLGMLATYSQYLFAVGYFKKANKFTGAACLNDPQNVGVRVNYFMSFALQGNKQRAEEEFEN